MGGLLDTDLAFARWDDDQVISEEQGRELAEELGISFMETSAKTNTNVEEAFFSLARSVDVPHLLGWPRLFCPPFHHFIIPPLDMRHIGCDLDDLSLFWPDYRDIKTRLIDSAGPDPSSGTSAPSSTSISVNQPSGVGAKAGCC